MTRRTIWTAVLAMAFLGGCAQAAPAGSSPALTPSSAGSLRPPKEPTDNSKVTTWVVGTVTNGGSGPCYGLVTDDGTQYALYSGDGLELVKGTRIKVNTKPALVRIHCGDGKFVEMTAAEPVQ